MLDRRHLSNQRTQPTTRLSYWRSTLIVATVFALMSPAVDLMISPEGGIIWGDSTGYLPLGLMLLAIFGPEGFVCAILFVPQFLAYFAVFILICRAVLAFVRYLKAGTA